MTRELDATRPVATVADEPPHLVALAPQHNSEGLHDASGAFRPEARAFVRVHEDKRPLLVHVNNHDTPQGMRRAVIAAIDRARDAACVALFCHGWRRGVQLGFTIDNVGTLADVCTAALAPTGVVALYACDAGRDLDADREDDIDGDAPGGDGGFADALRDALRSRRPEWAGWVDAHTRTGHSTQCPDVRRFEADGTSLYIVPRESHLWKPWRLALRHGDLRLRYPLLTRDAVASDLQP